jgi:hypothetical protein
MAVPLLSNAPYLRPIAPSHQAALMNANNEESETWHELLLLSIGGYLVVDVGSSQKFARPLGSKNKQHSTLLLQRESHNRYLGGRTQVSHFVVLSIVNGMNDTRSL